MKGLLKFITCGSVDDGKSTLIGHILYDSKLLYADQEKALELDSKVGSREGKIDYSLLLDGLMAEREQGITIDVAYRYFTTDNRSFIVADTPGHEEYTRNMAVGASFADLAVILIDEIGRASCRERVQISTLSLHDALPIYAKQGVLVQTRRHARICALMGIRYFVFAVNKMDLVSYDEKVFAKIQEHIDNDDRVIVLSASSMYFLETIFEGMKVELVCTTLKVSNGRILAIDRHPFYYEKIKCLKQMGIEQVDEMYYDSKWDEVLIPICKVSHKVENGQIL